jgi:hypothetical protein
MATKSKKNPAAVALGRLAVSRNVRNPDGSRKRNFRLHGLTLTGYRSKIAAWQRKLLPT